MMTAPITGMSDTNVQPTGLEGFTELDAMGQLYPFPAIRVSEPTAWKQCGTLTAAGCESVPCSHSPVGWTFLSDSRESLCRRP